MPNPMPAFKNSTCDNCDEEIEEGADVYFHDGNKLCVSCAEDENIVCDCGSYKKPEYDQCYNCFHE